jgi:hypothetical protein
MRRERGGCTTYSINQATLPQLEDAREPWPVRGLTSREGVMTRAENLRSHAAAQPTFPNADPAERLGFGYRCLLRACA